MIFVASPFQLASAIVYCQLNNLSIKNVIIVNDDISVEKYENILNLFDIDNTNMCCLSFSKKTFPGQLLVIVKLIAYCKSRRVIIGSENNVYLILFSIFSSERVFVDDGTEVFHKDNTHKNFGFFKKFLFYLFTRWVPEKRFSILRNNNHKIEAVNHFKSRLGQTNQISCSQVLLILSPLCEEGILSIEDYQEIMQETVLYFTSKQNIDKFIIASHPRSSSEILELTAEIINSISHSKIWHPSTTVEMELLQLDTIPRCLFSFESTASLIAEALLSSDIEHFCYSLPVDKMQKYREERIKISSKYKELFGGVFINAE